MLRRRIKERLYLARHAIEMEGVSGEQVDPQWADIQRRTMEVIYGKFGLWDPPCQHPGPVWTIGSEGTGRCTMCLATWTLADEHDREARKAAGPPPGESDRDRFWREFRETTRASRPLIMPLPAGYPEELRP